MELVGFDFVQTENGSKRLALVFGNSTYGEAFSELNNPQKDAQDVKAKLESLGFTVENGPFLDRTYHDMLGDAEDFTKCMCRNVTDIVVYYAGHGCSMSKCPVFCV